MCMCVCVCVCVFGVSMFQNIWVGRFFYTKSVWNTEAKSS